MNEQSDYNATFIPHTLEGDEECTIIQESAEGTYFHKHVREEKRTGIPSPRYLESSADNQKEEFEDYAEKELSANVCNIHLERRFDDTLTMDVVREFTNKLAAELFK